MSKSARAGQPSPENVSHNLDISREQTDGIEKQKPQRDVSEADFGAEYHGFTGFEQAGKGSPYKRK